MKILYSNRILKDQRALDLKAVLRKEGLVRTIGGGGCQGGGLSAGLSPLLRILINDLQGVQLRLQIRNAIIVLSLLSLKRLHDTCVHSSRIAGIDPRGGPGRG
jgi:hypothetical protein